MSSSGPDLVERIQRLSFETTLHLDSFAIRSLVNYAAYLAEAARDVNLTAARTGDQVFEILIAPSLGVQAAWPRDDEPPRLAVDIGSGNGFPGIAVALTWPACQVVMVERRKKKARAIQACLDNAEITNAEALGCDAREIKNERPELLGTVDLVTLRAVGSLAETTKLAAPLLAPCGRIVHWKSATLGADERRAGAAMAADLGLDVLADVPQPLGDGILVIYCRSERGA